MMKKSILIFIFLIGFTIFSYPFISNLFATKEHYTLINDYHEKVHEMEAEQITKEKAKAREHNEQLAKSEVVYVDPFSDEEESESTVGNKSYYDALQINPAIGTIHIPKIDVELPIYHGTGEKTLSRGVGHLENSSLPSGELGTHSVLTAHRGLPSSKLFRNMDEMAIGDHFFVHVLDETLAYEVQSVQIVLPHETEWLQFSEEDNIVTLLTCEPYMINTHRMLVTGYLVPYEEEIESSQEEAINLPFFIMIGIVIAGIFTIWLIWRHKRKGGRANEEK